MSAPSLYRRHRPRTFEDVVGQDHVVRTLRNAVGQGKVHHAYLFVGSRGTGKTSMAKILASCLDCERGGPTVTPCGECESCLSIQRATSLDVVEMDAASNNSVDDVRELRERVQTAPSGGKWRVYILDEAHMLTTQAWNALLKTLEEPPPQTVFVLATTEAHKVPATVVDRCHRFDFTRPTGEQIGRVLARVAEKESLTLTPGAVALVSRHANGSFRDALGTLEQLVTYAGDSVTEQDAVTVLGIGDDAQLFDAVRAVIDGDPGQALRVIQDVAAHGRDLGSFTRELERHARDLLVCTILGGVPPEVRLTPERDGWLDEQARAIGRDQATRLLELLATALTAARDGADGRAMLELALVKAADPAIDPALRALQARLSRIEDRLAGGGGPAPAGPGGSPAPQANAQPKVEAQTSAPQAPRAETPSSAAAQATPAPQPASSPEPQAAVTQQPQAAPAQQAAPAPQGAAPQQQRPQAPTPQAAAPQQQAPAPAPQGPAQSQPQVAVGNGGQIRVAPAQPSQPLQEAPRPQPEPPAYDGPSYEQDDPARFGYEDDFQEPPAPFGQGAPQGQFAPQRQQPATPQQPAPQPSPAPLREVPQPGATPQRQPGSGTSGLSAVPPATAVPAGPAVSQATAVADPAAAPSPAAPTGGPTLEEVISVWPAIIDNVRGRDQLCAVALERARVVDLDGAELTIAFPTDAAFYRGTADREERRLALREALREVTGSALSARFELRDLTTAPAPSGDHIAGETLATPAAQAPPPPPGAAPSSGSLDEHAIVAHLMTEFDAEELTAPDQEPA